MSSLSAARRIFLISSTCACPLRLRAHCSPRADHLAHLAEGDRVVVDDGGEAAEHLRLRPPGRRTGERAQKQSGTQKQGRRRWRGYGSGESLERQPVKPANGRRDRQNVKDGGVGGQALQRARCFVLVLEISFQRLRARVRARARLRFRLQLRAVPELHPERSTAAIRS